MGLFRRTKAPPVEEKRKRFRIELGWRGMFGLVVVCFCLFFWMFLLGIWAGQTILLPPRNHQAKQTPGQSKESVSQTVREEEPPRQQPRTSTP